jgi:hypothetical protein
VREELGSGLNSTHDIFLSLNQPIIIVSAKCGYKTKQRNNRPSGDRQGGNGFQTSNPLK